MRELLDLQKQEADTALAYEEISNAQYNAEIERILLIRAAAIQATMAEAKTEKERADLKKELAEQYTDYQELEKQKIEEIRTADRRQYEDKLRQDQSKIASVTNTINLEKAKLEELEAEYQDRMATINAELIGTTSLQESFLKKIQDMAPSFAESARSVINSINKIKGAYLDALDATGNAPPSSHSGGYSKPFYNDKGGDIDHRDIPWKKDRGDYSEGFFGVQGENNRWYRTTTEMNRAIRGYKEGGVIPDLPQFRNDGLQIRVSGGERVINQLQNKRLDNMLSYHEQVRASQAGSQNSQSVSIGDIYISKDVEMSRVERFMEKYLRAGERKTIHRMGQNAKRRG